VGNNCSDGHGCTSGDCGGHWGQWGYDHDHGHGCKHGKCGGRGKGGKGGKGYRKGWGKGRKHHGKW
jgi:hypothetical protein